MKEEALKLADELAFHQGELSMWTRNESCRMIRRLVEELDKKSKPINHYEPTAWINHIKQTGGDFYELNVSGRGEPLYRHPPQTKSLSADEIKEAFNQWLMLDEGVARFDYQLKHTWVAEQWERWQKAFKSAEVLK